MSTALLHRLHQLAGPSIVRQDAGGSPIYWRVRRLTVAEIVDAEATSTAIGALRVQPATSPDEEPPQAVPTAEQIVSMAERYRPLVCASVDAVSADAVEWTTCTVVADDQADPEAARVSIGVLDLATQGRIAAAAMGAVREASAWVTPFRA